MNKDERIQQLKDENNNLKNKLQSYIPRRRVRRVFKQLKNILMQDLEDDNIAYINYLKSIIIRYRNEKETITVDEPLIIAIEHLLGFYDGGN